jgi:superfamily II RNA helicase
MEMADWIRRTKQRMVFVPDHARRTVALAHALHAGEGESSIISRSDCAMDASRSCAPQLPITNKRRRIDRSSGYLGHFVLATESARLLPRLSFCFSQCMCEQLLSVQLLSCSQTHHIRTILRLAREDRELLQISLLLGLLENGMGIRHC